MATFIGAIVWAVAVFIVAGFLSLPISWQLITFGVACSMISDMIRDVVKKD